jgi:hypothetical protein
MAAILIVYAFVQKPTVDARHEEEEEEEKDERYR